MLETHTQSTKERTQSSTKEQIAAAKRQWQEQVNSRGSKAQSVDFQAQARNSYLQTLNAQSVNSQINSQDFQVNSQNQAQNSQAKIHAKSVNLQANSAKNSQTQKSVNLQENSQNSQANLQNSQTNSQNSKINSRAENIQKLRQIHSQISFIAAQGEPAAAFADETKRRAIYSALADIAHDFRGIQKSGDSELLGLFSEQDIKSILGTRNVSAHGSENINIKAATKFVKFRLLPLGERINAFLNNVNLGVERGSENSSTEFKINRLNALLLGFSFILLDLLLVSSVVVGAMLYDYFSGSEFIELYQSYGLMFVFSLLFGVSTSFCVILFAVGYFIHKNMPKIKAWKAWAEENLEFCAPDHFGSQAGNDFITNNPLRGFDEI